MCAHDVHESRSRVLLVGIFHRLRDQNELRTKIILLGRVVLPASSADVLYFGLPVGGGDTGRSFSGICGLLLG